MTLFHFVGTCSLCFLPHAVYYYATTLHESQAKPTIIKGGVVYLGTTGLKLMLLATILPNSDTEGEETVDYTEECLKSIINLVDVVGVYVALRVLTHRSVAASLRYQCLGLGWASADALLRRGIPLYLDAMSAEFSWKPLRSAVASNFNLVQVLSVFATCHLLFCRKHRPAGADLVLWVLVALAAVAQSLAAVAGDLAPAPLSALGGWTAVAVEGATTAVLAVSSASMFVHVVGGGKSE